MGSASDRPTMQDAADVLEELGVEATMRVVSAHRTPLGMIDYGRGAAGRGVQVIIAGAGGAAHLPGMLASVTNLPVIGVPVPTAHLQGLDSLLSIVQMPAGIPVATMAIGGARNAGLMAARILALTDGAVRAALAAHTEGLVTKARDQDRELGRAGGQSGGARGQ
jgi:5-(carboxyamino)imidazole ribonucleotide mutase